MDYRRCHHIVRGLVSIALVAIGAVDAARIQITEDQLLDRIKGGWCGKFLGVYIGGPFEGSRGWLTNSYFTIPDFRRNGMMEGGYNIVYAQDDLYAETPFMKAMDAAVHAGQSIYSVTMKAYADSFKVSTFPVWGANAIARELLNSGVEAPQSGMWGGTGATQHNKKADAIDWQIEMDWIGYMCPAMPATALRLSDSAGHVVSYGDGLYGGHLFAVMEALTWLYADIHDVVREGLKAIPPQSECAQAVKDITDFHDGNQGDAQACWNMVDDKWAHLGDKAVINGCMVVIGLMYGDGDPARTVEYALRGGWDADCNASTAGGVVGVLAGYQNMPAEWKERWERCDTAKSQVKPAEYTYTLRLLVEQSVAAARRAILDNGGSYANGVHTVHVEEVVQPAVYEKYGFDPVPNPAYTTRLTVVPHAARRAPGHPTNACTVTPLGRRVLADHRALKLSVGAGNVVLPGTDR